MKVDETYKIKEILNGNTREYEYFLETYGPQVFNLIARIVVSQEDAEELTSDVFLKAFQQLSAFKSKSSFSTWIYRIATNMAISAVRKRKDYILPWDDVLYAHLSQSEIDEALEDETEEQIQKLSKAIDQLNADERAMITLFYTDQKSLSEIAFIMNLSENTIKVKLHRIRKKLYILIQNEAS